jgi:hypothetical protein
MIPIGGPAIPEEKVNPSILAISDPALLPPLGAALGAIATAGLWLAARRGGPAAMPLRLLAAVAGTWLALCLAYVILRPDTTFAAYLLTSTDGTKIIAAVGLACYLGSVLRRGAEKRLWKRSSALLAGVTLMGSAFVRAAYQPSITLAVEAPLAIVFIATVWRFRAELLVYLAILGLAATVVLGTRDFVTGGLGLDVPAWASAAAAPQWVVSTAAGLSVAMVIAASLLGIVPRQELNVRWYRQGLLIVPVAAATVAAMGAGYLAVWYGASWHTAWALGAWWVVLLVSGIGLRQPDLFGFSSIGASLAAVATFAALGGDRIEGYWGRYPPVLLVLSLGAALLAAALSPMLRRRTTAGFPRALYLAAAATALGALAVEPWATSPWYLGLDLLMAAGVLALAHAHRAPAWVNYLVAGLATGGVAALAHLAPGTPEILWHHQLIRVASAASVGWLMAALALREILRRTASDRTARRQSVPLTVFGMATTLGLAIYLSVQQTRVYLQFLAEGQSATLPLLGPLWGMGGWLAVLLAWLLSMWLVRHTARTFLFYLFGIAAAIYAGLFWNTENLHNYLIYAIAGYASAHLLVYLFEARFMGLLARTCALYREENRASTTIFTLAVISCFVAAVLAAMRLNDPAALTMLAVMAGVFLLWSFGWMRGEMLYPAVFMVTLTTLAVWHNAAHPMIWDAGRLAINAIIMAVSAFVWLAIGKSLHPIRGEIFTLAAPARACSVILGVVGMIFAGAMAVSPTFAADIWRQPRSAWDWTLGLTALALLMGYFAWARFVFSQRFYGLMSGLAVLLLGLYVGIYVGVRL